MACYDIRNIPFHSHESITHTVISTARRNLSVRHTDIVQTLRKISRCARDDKMLRVKNKISLGEENTGATYPLGGVGSLHLFSPQSVGVYIMYCLLSWALIVYLTSFLLLFHRNIASVSTSSFTVPLLG